MMREKQRLYHITHSRQAVHHVFTLSFHLQAPIHHYRRLKSREASWCLCAWMQSKHRGMLAACRILISLVYILKDLCLFCHLRLQDKTSHSACSKMCYLLPSCCKQCRCLQRWIIFPNDISYPAEQCIYIQSLLTSGLLVISHCNSCLWANHKPLSASPHQSQPSARSPLKSYWQYWPADG